LIEIVSWFVFPFGCRALEGNKPVWYNRGSGHDFEKSRLSQARWLFRTAAPFVWLETLTDTNHLLPEDHLQVLVLCPLVSTLQFFLPNTKSASDFLEALAIHVA
jgi:hypothetical protein